jgi:hypothetical protein
MQADDDSLKPSEETKQKAWQKLTEAMSFEDDPK